MRKCDSCKWFGQEGGDFVPYGSGSVQLPVDDVCNHPKALELDDADYDFLIEMFLVQGLECDEYEELDDGWLKCY